MKFFDFHSVDHRCGLQQESLSSHSKHDVFDFIKTMYPKQKVLTLVFDIITQHNLIDEQLYFVQFQHVHIADFCTFINNKYGKFQSTDTRFIKLCIYF